MSSQHDLIDEIIKHTGIDLYKLKWLSKNESELLLAASVNKESKMKDLLVIGFQI